MEPEGGIDRRLLIGGAVVVIVVAVWWWKKRQSASASSASTSTTSTPYGQPATGTGVIEPMIINVGSAANPGTPTSVPSTPSTPSIPGPIPTSNGANSVPMANPTPPTSLMGPVATKGSPPASSGVVTTRVPVNVPNPTIGSELVKAGVPVSLNGAGNGWNYDSNSLTYIPDVATLTRLISEGYSIVKIPTPTGTRQYYNPLQKVA